MTVGTEANDILTNDQAVSAETIDALGGNDVITIQAPLGAESGGKSVAVDGGAGRDTLIVENEGMWSALSGSGLGGSVQLLVAPGVYYTLSWSAIERVEIRAGMSGGDYVTGDSADLLRLFGGLGGTLDTGAGHDEVYFGHDPAQGNPLVVHGGTGNDIVDFSLVAAANVDAWVAFGEDGNDTLRGSAFNDRLYGADGNDEIIFGTGVDQGDGGNGIDGLSADLGQSGVDMVFDLVNNIYSTPVGTSFTNFEYFAGPGLVSGSGDDVVFTTLAERRDTIALGAGNDVVTIVNGVDFVNGGVPGAGAVDSGFDTLILDYSLAASVRMIGNIQSNAAGSFGTFTDDFRRTVTFEAIDRFIITTGVANDNVSTGAGNDEIRTGDGGDTINAGAGDDLIDGGTGADFMVGGPGNDLFYVDNAGDSVNDGPAGGNDTVITGLQTYRLHDNIETLIGTLGSGQVLVGNNSDNSITGAEGNDTLEGQGGVDSLAGGLGDDIYIVTAGDIVVEAANAGNDEVGTALAAYTLAANVERLTGLSANGQALTGNGLANLLTGAGGNDILDGGLGADTLAGGLGNDIYQVDVGDSVVEADNAGTDEVRTALAAYTLGANVEKLTGTAATGQALSGNDLANTIVGGNGNDTLDGGAGADQLAGGLGNDVYIVDAGDVVSDSGGTDEVRTALAAYTLGASIEKLTGLSASGQALTGNGGDNLVTGGGGNDILDGGPGGADTLAGGLGNDVYVVDGGETLVEAADAGADEVRTALAAYSLGANLETLTGTAATGQSLTGNGLANLITGGAGNDTIDGGLGADQLAGGLGNDLYFVGAGDLVVEAGGAGTDEVRTALAAYTLAANVETLTGTSASGQALTGNDLANLITGGNGNDTLDGGGGADQLLGGLGNDVYVVDDAGDLVAENAGQGTDEVRTSLATASLAAYANVENLTGLSATGQTLTGNAGNNVVTGGSGNDVLRLYDGGNDTVLAGAGNDNIFFTGSLTSADVVNGGAGVDTLVVQGPYGALTLTASITQIENVSILAGDNMNFGDPGTNRYDYVLTTNDANFAAGVQARINGAALLEGEDFTFNGSAETDASFVVYGGKGKDTLTGGFGNDIFIYPEERFAPGDTVNGGPGGYDGIFFRGNYTIDFNAPGYFGLMTGIENMTLTSATDERYARGGGTEFDYNIILADNMTLPGVELTVSGALLTANETMVLDASQETDGTLRIFGGKAADILKGGANADLIHGNLGADIMTGGGGSDIFRYQSVLESYSVTIDKLLDFTPGTDKIDLSRTDSNQIIGGDQAFTWIGSNAYTNSPGQLRAYENAGTWFVEGDVNGDGFSDLVIALTLQGPTPLGAGDFIL
jgi:Ca2+-binding RTX toxin-like protein